MVAVTDAGAYRLIHKTRPRRRGRVFLGLGEQLYCGITQRCPEQGRFVFAERFVLFFLTCLWTETTLGGTDVYVVLSEG